MGLIYELIVDTEAGTSTIHIEANSKEEALENGRGRLPPGWTPLFPDESGSE